jgi:hypothetical protein
MLHRPMSRRRCPDRPGTPLKGLRTRPAMTVTPQTSLHNTPQPTVDITSSRLSKGSSRHELVVGHPIVLAEPDATSRLSAEMSRLSASPPFHEFVNHMFQQLINHMDTGNGRTFDRAQNSHAQRSLGGRRSVLRRPSRQCGRALRRAVASFRSAPGPSDRTRS